MDSASVLGSMEDQKGVGEDLLYLILYKMSSLFYAPLYPPLIVLNVR